MEGVSFTRARGAAAQRGRLTARDVLMKVAASAQSQDTEASAPAPRVSYIGPSPWYTPYRNWLRRYAGHLGILGNRAAVRFGYGNPAKLAKREADFSLGSRHFMPENYNVDEKGRLVPASAPERYARWYDNHKDMILDDADEYLHSRQSNPVASSWMGKLLGSRWTPHDIAYSGIDKDYLPVIDVSDHVLRNSDGSVVTDSYGRPMYSGDMGVAQWMATKAYGDLPPEWASGSGRALDELWGIGAYVLPHTRGLALGRDMVDNIASGRPLSAVTDAMFMGPAGKVFKGSRAVIPMVLSLGAAGAIDSRLAKSFGRDGRQRPVEGVNWYGPSDEGGGVGVAQAIRESLPADSTDPDALSVFGPRFLPGPLDYTGNAGLSVGF